MTQARGPPGQGLPGSANREVAARGQSCASEPDASAGQTEPVFYPLALGPALRLFELPVTGTPPQDHGTVCVVGQVPPIRESGAGGQATSISLVTLGKLFNFPVPHFLTVQRK